MITQPFYCGHVTRYFSRVNYPLVVLLLMMEASTWSLIDG